MKVYGLTPTLFVYAVITGAIIAGIVIFANLPHPVAPTVQTLQPVPTPPPVVIGSSPAPQYIATSDDGLNYIIGLILIVIGLGVGFAFVLRSPLEKTPTFNTSLSTTMNEMGNTVETTLPFVLVFFLILAGAVVGICIAIRGASA
jgi:hypothetical protein